MSAANEEPDPKMSEPGTEDIDWEMPPNTSEEADQETSTSDNEEPD